MYGIFLNRQLKLSLTRQLYNQLQKLILKNDLKADFKLPSSRVLAKNLMVARNIVVEVYEQLTAEGYLETRKGAGTFIARGAFLKKYKNISSLYSPSRFNPYQENNAIHFSAGIPDLKLFPKKKWANYLRDAYLYAHSSYYTYGHSGGTIELKKRLALFLFKTKGIKCHPNQIMILAGSAQCILAAGQIMAERNARIMVEDPSFNGSHRIFNHLGLEIIPAATDQKGIKIDSLPQITDCSIIITPSHHFPLASILPIQRRIQLLELAHRKNHYIIENDYNSEFRYAGCPVSSLHFLSPDRVIHIGTFSECLYPSIRLGYMILPPQLIEKGLDIIQVNELNVPSIPQIALASFIAEGELERHINRMKKVYEKRRALLIKELDNLFGSQVKILGDAAGLYVTAAFSHITWEKNTTAALQKKYRIQFDLAENHALRKGKNQDKIILGYGNLDDEQIRQGIIQLKGLTDELKKQLQ